MAPAAEPRWALAAWSALADGPHAPLAAAIEGVAIDAGGCFASASGLHAAVVSLAGLRALPDVEVSVDAEGQRSTMAILLTERRSPELVAELRELLSVGEWIALPYGVAEVLPADFARRGHLEQLIAPDVPAVFDVFERVDDARAALVADAPIALGEEPDNLQGREDWFRRRQVSSTRQDTSSRQVDRP